MVIFPLKIVIFPLKMMISHSYVNVYQMVYLHPQPMGDLQDPKMEVRKRTI